MAKDTLEILAKKYYINDNNEKIDIQKELEFCKKETKLFSSEELFELTAKQIPEVDFASEIETWNCSSLQAILRLVEEEDQEKSCA